MAAGCRPPRWPAVPHLKPAGNSLPLPLSRFSPFFILGHDRWQRAGRWATLGGRRRVLSGPSGDDEPAGGLPSFSRPSTITFCRLPSLPIPAPSLFVAATDTREPSGRGSNEDGLEAVRRLPTTNACPKPTVPIPGSWVYDSNGSQRLPSPMRWSPSTPPFQISALFPLHGPYGGYAQSWQNTAPPSSDIVVKVSHPPAPPPAVASRPPPSPLPPPPPPPPPPPVIGSSGGSGSMCSGSDAPPLHPPSPGLALGFSKSTFTYEELAVAANMFSSENLLGQGGFGYVHKGILPKGKEVAIKQLKSGSGQGEREFQAEVQIISRVHHKHLVSLVGYCISGTKRLLVYEFVPNNTLEFHLHEKSQPPMEWTTRLKIALGAARGLAYLHEDCEFLGSLI
ncbi:hypothetical protein EJ110_NYTH31819 [Nymphaea thermarum]|nr:hypothetical protein EJ110_NYTH31819 [Nymphaea thermarum]